MADVDISKYRAQVVRDGFRPSNPGFVESEGQNPVDPAGSGQNHLPVTIGTPANGLSVTDAQVLTIDKAQIFAGTSSQFVKGDGTLDSTAYGTGSVTSVALTMPTAFSVSGSPITSSGTLAVTATGTTAQYIRGDGSLATLPALTGFVPYTGATADVNLGTHDLAAERGTFQNNGSSDTLTVNHTSGSGYGIIVTKGGANEALYVSKTSGSGNAMTVVGGRTSLVDLALSSVTNTAGDFLTISGGVVHKRTAAEVRTDIGAGTGNGTVTSVAALTLGTSGTDLSSTVANGTTTPVITLNVPTASAANRGALSASDWSTFNNKQNALTNPVTGTGASGQVAYFTGTTTISSESNLFWDATNDRLGINVSSPVYPLHIKRASNINIGFGQQNSGISLEAVNDAVNANIPMSYYASGHYFFNGNVGIATATPGQKLQIGNGSETGNHYLRIYGAASDIYFGQTGSNLFGAGNGQVLVTDSTYTGPFAIGTLSGSANLLFGTANIIRLTISNTGAAIFNNGSNQSTIISTTFAGIEYTRGATVFGFIGTENSGSGGMRYNSIAGNFEHKFYNNSNLSLTLASTGAATFSSSISAGDLISTSYGTARIQVTSTTNSANSAFRLGAKDSAGTTKNAGLYYVAGTTTATTFLSFAADDNNYQFNVLANGNVGIGTTAPAIKFQVNSGGTGSNSFSAFFTDNSANQNGLAISHFNNNSRIYATYNGTGSDQNLSFWTTLSNGTQFERLTILAGGNVLIGTTTDNGSRFQVSGAITATSFSLGSGNGQLVTSGFWGTQLTAGTGSFANFALLDSATNGIMYNPTGTLNVLFTNNVLATRYLNPSGPYGTSQANARNHFTQFNAGNAGLAGGWIAGAFGDALGNRIVIGQYAGVAVIAGHNGNLDNWASMALATGGGNVMVGTTTDSGDKLRVAGTTFTNEIMTLAPETESRSGVAWRLGEASIASVTPNRRLRVKVGGVEYYIGAVEV